MFQLDYGDHRPLYEQIKDKVKGLILCGVLKENDKIPAVRELASTLAINPNTIQKAYHELESEGYIYSLRAKGSFVTPRKVIAERTDNAEMENELRDIVRKMKFCRIGDAEILRIVNAELKGGTEE